MIILDLSLLSLIILDHPILNRPYFLRFLAFQLNKEAFYSSNWPKHSVNFWSSKIRTLMFMIFIDRIFNFSKQKSSLTLMFEFQNFKNCSYTYVYVFCTLKYHVNFNQVPSFTPWFQSGQSQDILPSIFFYFKIIKNIIYFAYSKFQKRTKKIIITKSVWPRAYLTTWRSFNTLN